MSKQKSYKGKKQYAIYAIENRAEKNKKRKILKHLKSHPCDSQAKDALLVTPVHRKKSFNKSIESNLIQQLDKVTKGLINKHQYIKNSTLTKAIRLASEVT